MKTILAEYSGFCHGVHQTIAKIESILKDCPQKKVSCIGLPVHNPQVTNRLVESGLHVVDSINEIKEGILVIRAHGLPPKLVQQAEEKGLDIVDTTCTIVRKVHTIAHDLVDAGYAVIIAGESKHPEVKSIFGYTDEKGVICSSLDEIKAVHLKGKIGIVSQTTFSKKTYTDMINWLSTNEYNELRIFNTLCNSIAKRSEAAVEIAQQTEVMLIVGGKMSSNTKRLYEACKAVNTNSFHVETKDEIASDWVQNVDQIGITAGASTPQWIIDDIVNFIKNL